jgi:hypothetical protein
LENTKQSKLYDWLRRCVVVNYEHHAKLVVHESVSKVLVDVAAEVCKRLLVVFVKNQCPQDMCPMDVFLYQLNYSKEIFKSHRQSAHALLNKYIQLKM